MKVICREELGIVVDVEDDKDIEGDLCTCTDKCNLYDTDDDHQAPRVDNRLMAWLRGHS